MAARWSTRRAVWGLARAARDLGVRLYEHTRVEKLERRGAGLLLTTPDGRLAARRVMLATNAFPGLLPAMRRRVVPVYDQALMTEPLSDDQWAAIGWPRYQGVGDAANRFHYYRRTSDGRILWGGYDAIYHYGDGMKTEFEQRPQTFEKLAAHFFTTFPQLAGVRFTHAWGARSTPAPASASSGGRPTAAGSPMRSATRATVSASLASARWSGSTSWMETVASSPG